VHLANGDIKIHPVYKMRHFAQTVQFILYIRVTLSHAADIAISFSGRNDLVMNHQRLYVQRVIKLCVLLQVVKRQALCHK
jgi:hypothetical protein